MASAQRGHGVYADGAIVPILASLARGGGMSVVKMEWVGEFQLQPEEEPIRGVLRYHPTDGIQLLTNGYGGNWDERKEYSQITGVIDGQQKVSLLNCFDFSVEGNFSGYEKRVIIVNSVIFGINKIEPTQSTFSRFQLHSPNITRWMGSDGFRIGYGSRRGVTMRWQSPASFKAKIDPTRNLEFFCGSRGSSRLVGGKVKFEILPSYRVRYSKNVSWDIVYRDVHSLDLFFCFAARSWLGPPRVGLESRESRRYVQNEKVPKRRRLYHEQHNVLISQGWYRIEDSGEARQRWPLFRFDETQPKIATILARWFERRDVIERAVKLLRASQGSSAGLETVFLFLAQTVEFLHRETIGGTAMSKQKFEDLRAALTAAIPASLGREAAVLVEQRLAFFNEPGLRRRLKEVFRAIQNPPSFARNYKSASSSIAEYRNAFTHHLPLTKANGEWEREVSQLSSILEGIIELYICKLLGFEEHEISKMIDNDYELGWALNQ